MGQAHTGRNKRQQLNRGDAESARISTTGIREEVVLKGQVPQEGFLVENDLEMTNAPNSDMGDRPQHVWVDAVCINQSSKTEGPPGVYDGRYLHSGPKNVLVWLGRDDPSPNVIWVLDVFIPRFQAMYEAKGPEILLTRDYVCTDEDVVDFLGPETCSRWRSSFVPFCTTLMNLRLVYRWAVQEIYVYRTKGRNSVSLLISAYRSTWSLLISSLRCLDDVHRT